ncbi:hypothetical protein Btru_035701 [Bulinus truncatus]|nr:hypothetical protein Btru_035701 [Bulinus truncatus]
MWDVLFIYRVLLPPLIILVLGCVWPTEEYRQNQQVVMDHTATVGRHRINSSTVTSSAEELHNNVLHFLGLKLSANGSHPRKMESGGQIGKADYVKADEAGWRHESDRMASSSEIYLPKGKEAPNQIISPARIRFENGTLKLGEIKFRTNFEPKQISAPLTSKPHSRSVSRSQDRHRKRRSTEDQLLKKIRLRTSPVVAPDYMVQLYHLLEGTHYHLLRNTVVTSFININDQDPDSEYISSRLEDDVRSVSNKHVLVFDITLSQEEKTVQYSELRLFLSQTCDSQELEACNVSGEVNIYELNIETESSTPTFVTSKNFSIVNGTWESVNVTSLVQAWMNPGLKAFEVIISYPAASENISSTNITLEIAGGKDPLLVVFSKKSGPTERLQHSIEKRDTYLSLQAIESSLFQRNSTGETNYSRHYFQGLVNAVKSMEQASYAPAFQDPSMDSEPREMPTAPRDDDDGGLTETALNFTFQSKVPRTFLRPDNQIRGDTLQKNISSTTRIRRTSTSQPSRALEEDVDSSSDEGDKDAGPDPLFLARVRREAKARFRRHVDVLFNSGQIQTAHERFKRNKKKRNGSCRRHELYIEFKDIKWDKSIIFPEGYQAFECVGKCYFPIASHLSPTKHAIIQTLLHTSYPNVTTRACCVPTKLDPISILYYDHSSNNSITYDYTYEGMIATECGCR